MFLMMFVMIISMESRATLFFICAMREQGNVLLIDCLSGYHLFTAEEDVAEGMQEGQPERHVEQAETSGTNVEREISTTEQLNVPEAVEDSTQRSTPTTTAPYAQRLLSARSHLAPFSFPQVRRAV